MNGATLIARERARQISKEKWSPRHDDTHVNHELAWAARCYAVPHTDEQSMPHGEWPWKSQWWKPSNDPVRNLVKAGALIAAEIDRVQRAMGKKTNNRKPLGYHGDRSTCGGGPTDD